MKTGSKTGLDLREDISISDGREKMYGIVLAAGNGRRMKDFIHHYYDSHYPKQYVAFTGKRSMVQHTLRRAERLISREKLLVVVDPKHQEIVDKQLSDRPDGTLIFQPQNRETAPGILLPGAGRDGLRTHAVPGRAQGVPQGPQKLPRLAALGAVTA